VAFLKNERDTLIFLSYVPQLTPYRLQELLRHSESATHLLDASPSELENFGASAALAEFWHASFRNDALIAQANRALEQESKGLYQITTLVDADYPEALRELSDPPAVLYFQGSWPRFDTSAIGVVGSRKPSSYGIAVTTEFTRRFVEAGWIVVSGLAQGIDTCAHRTTLDAGGRTIAVLGNGLGHTFPAGNRELQKRVAAEGLVISEFPYSREPRAEQFPRRNRIVAGLSRGVLVTEAGHRSGALISARLAIEGGRDVFVIPGSIYSSVSAGCHRLIKEGASLVSAPEDIFEAWGAPVSRSVPTGLTAEESGIVAAIGTQGVTVDELAEQKKIPFSDLARILLELELRGVIHALPGQRYGLNGKVKENNNDESSQDAETQGEDQAHQSVRGGTRGL
jgi:DNA processing protein